MSDQPSAFETEPTQADLFRLFASGEPAELRTQFLALPNSSRALHPGSRIPSLNTPLVQRGALWLPVNIPVEKGPVDYLATFLTGSELFGEAALIATVTTELATYSRESVLRACATALAAIADDPAVEAQEARLFASRLRSGLRERAEQLLAAGRVVFTRESILALAKLAIVHCGEEASADLPIEITMPFLLIGVHDVFGTLTPEFAQPAPGVFDDEVVSWLSANQALHRSLDEPSIIASFEARWADPSNQPMLEVTAAFEQAMGFSLLDQAAVAMACWAGVRDRGMLIFDRAWLAALGISPDQLERILGRNAIDLVAAADEIAASELGPSDFNWNYNTFERFPLIALDAERYLVLDPALLLKKVLGWAPMYEINATSKRRMRRYESILEATTESYALMILRGAFGSGPSERLFVERQLKAMDPHKKCADAAVDYGGRWAVIEVTARRIPMDIRHGKPVGANAMLEMIIEELRQVASTGRLLMTRRDLLTRETELAPIRIYPVVVMVEGFPTNPITLTEVRRLAESEGLFAGLDTGPIEVLDLSELEILEQLAEEGGPSYVELVERKARSAFWADSVRNFVIAESLLRKPMSSRVLAAFDSHVTRLRGYFGSASPEEGGA